MASIELSWRVWSKVGVEDLGVTGDRIGEKMAYTGLIHTYI